MVNQLIGRMRVTFHFWVNDLNWFLLFKFKFIKILEFKNVNDIIHLNHAQFLNTHTCKYKLTNFKTQYSCSGHVNVHAQPRYLCVQHFPIP